MAAKTTSKTAAAPKVRSVASAAKKLVKKSAAVAKAALGKSVKPAVKTPAKTAAKSASKLPAKTIAKPAPKTAAKPITPVAATVKAPAMSKAADRKPVSKPTAVTKRPAAKTAATVAPAPAIKSKAAPAVGKPIAAPVAPEKNIKTAAAPEPATTGKIAKMTSASQPTAPAGNVPAGKAAKSAARTKSTAAGHVLTEDEIRNSPASDYMNDEQLAFFHERLLQMRAEVLAREVDVKERLHQREIFADPADRASAEEEHWLDLRLRERESLLLRKIEDAFRRIRDKEYGYCEKTGEPIGVARLLARPTATVCVDIKGQDERAESQYRDR